MTHTQPGTLEKFHKHLFILFFGSHQVLPNLKCYHFHFSGPMHHDASFPWDSHGNTNLISKNVWYMIAVKGKEELKMLQKCKTHYIFIIIINTVHYYYTLPLPLLCFITFFLNHRGKNSFYRAIQYLNQSAKKYPYPFPPPVSQSPRREVTFQSPAAA